MPAAQHAFPPLTVSAWLRYDLVERTLPTLGDARRVLEVGPGMGALGARLAASYDYTGAEPDPTSCRIARERIEPFGGTVVCGDVSALPADETFDVVCSFEVIEHIEDDGDALRAWRERIRPGGWLVLTTPAFPERFGPWDELAGHIRRYTPEEMRARLTDAGLTPVRVHSYGFPAGSILESVRQRLVRGRVPERSADELTAASGRNYQPPPVLGRLTQFAAVPLRVLQRPFLGSRRGMGLFVLARRES